jgi:hypothetical protein
MRAVADADRIRAFMRALGREAEREATAYLAGGTTAVLMGWRDTTLDVDLKLVPETDDLLRVLSRLKNDLAINVELASPADFIPLPDGWEERSVFVAREGSVTFRHFDPYSQALSKLERGHDQDLEDVQALVERGLVERAHLRSYFEEIEPSLYRFPALDPPSFRAAVERLLSDRRG